MESDLADRVVAFMAREELAPPGSTVLAAVSGGQDSCALLHILAARREDLGIRVHAAHLDHGFRGADGEDDARFVRGLAERLGVSVLCGRADGPGTAQRRGMSVQEAARVLRHEFLERAADEAGADRIALGHTRDDHIETILLNILRGTGTDGLRGLRPRSGMRVRPLLCLERAETAAYCRTHDIAFRTDPSNACPQHLRSRIREELLPLLGSYYTPAIRETLVRLSDIAGTEADFLEEEAQRAAESLWLAEDGRVILPRGALARLHPALARRVARLAIRKVRGDLRDVEHFHVERVLAWARGEESPGSVTLGCGSERILLAPEAAVVEHVPAPAEALPFQRQLTVPGDTTVPEMGIQIRAEAADPGRGTLGPWEADLDADRVRLPLTVRRRAPGDRIRPRGGPGTRKVQDLLVDRKVPRASRDEVPIIVDGEGLVWVAGHAVADRAAASDRTRKVLRLRVEGLPPAGRPEASML